MIRSRLLLLFGALLASTWVGAQDTLAVPQALIATVWQDVSGGSRQYYNVFFSQEGNFDEDAGAVPNRPYRHLLGRWAYDDAERILTLSVDGLMGKGLVHERYREGADFYLRYKIIDVSENDLELLDLKTKQKRVFIATVPDDVEDQARKRIPKGKEPTEGFKLPTLEDF